MNGARVLVHATAVALGEAGRAFGAPAAAGVLIMGKSGSGKSDVALRLLAMGARLLSDDQTSLFVHEGLIYAEAPPSLVGMIEVRGVGIVHVEAAPPSPLVLAVQLDDTTEVERMPDRSSYALPEALRSLPSLPFVVLRPFEASTAAKIVVAAADAAFGRFPPDNATA